MDREKNYRILIDPPAHAGGTDLIATLNDRPPATAVGTCCPSSVILAPLAPVRHPARSQRIANLVSNAVEVEQGFLKPSIETAIDESRTRFQSASFMATLGSLAVVARSSMTQRFSRSSRLNQTRTHQRLRVVLKNHARDLDPSDRTSNQPPANSAGISNYQRAQKTRATTPANRMLHCVRSGSLNVCAARVSPSGLQNSRRRNRKKINVKRVNC